MATFTKRKNKWRAQVRKKGISKSAEFNTKTEAQRWALAIETQIDSGEFTNTPQIKFSQLIDRYVKEITPTKASARGETFRLLKIAKMQIGKVDLIDLNKSDFEKWQNERLSNVTAGTVLRERNTLNAVMNQAIKWNFIKKNPLKEVDAPKEPPPRTRRYTENEIEKLIYVSGYNDDIEPTTKISRVGAAILFAIETAMRASEICNLTWELTNLDNRTCFLPKTKNGHPRTVPLSKRAVKILLNLQRIKSDSDPTVFQIKAELLGSLFRKLKEKAGLKEADLHFHDTRREALTRLSKKLHLMELAKVSGHRDLSILQNTYYAPDISELANKLD
ncbi:site-specific integrase [Pasteurella multocida]|uniref:tyrosine-type recombinase/integrase n=1 Tax=Pasteurella multocida TaxID=747 RepID=UPI0029AD4EB4|nr:site-specific integrase [Pasteurella multocida]MDX3950126.1 site-specific integrase [Pasteurella multocida]